jgi:hypothetical protein
MKVIQLTGKGDRKHALVDDEWFDYLNQWTWQAYFHRYTWYALRCVGSASKGTYRHIYMHREVLEFVPNGKMVDHINKNGLDNRIENLRVCTNSENRRNSKIQRNNTLGYKGIALDKRTNTYRVRLNVNGKRRSFGYYPDVETAAKKYDELAKEFYGEFASLNFIEE